MNDRVIEADVCLHSERSAGTAVGAFDRPKLASDVRPEHYSGC